MPIYLDNAATSYPKPESVYRSVDHSLRHLGGSPGRGSYGMALDAGRCLLEIRDTVADLIGARDSSRIAFTSGATEALNLAFFGYLKAGDRVVTSTMEHNAVMRPLHVLQSRGVSVVQVAPGPDGCLHPAEIQKAVMADFASTRMVILSHASNVTGSIQPVEALGPWCRSLGILLVVDAAQTAGFLPIDVETMVIDMLAVPGHKHLMGPPGCGFLYVREGIQLTPLIYGGSGGDSGSPHPPEVMPDRLESGTLNLPALAGLKAGIDFIQQQGPANIRRHKTDLLSYLRDGLRYVPGMSLYGPSDGSQLAGVLSFNLHGHDPADIAFWLDTEHAICVRAGLHCAPDAHRTIGTFPRGTVRVSPGFFSGASDMDALLHALAALPPSR